MGRLVKPQLFNTLATHKIGASQFRTSTEDRVSRVPALLKAIHRLIF
jgi:hypothetical protein